MDMKVTVKSVSTVLKELEIELPAERVDEEFAKAMRDAKSAAHLNVKGFRPGRVPKALIEKRFGRAMESDIAHKLIDEVYSKALEREAIKPVAQGSIQKFDIKRGAPFQFTVQVEVRPVVEPTGYFGLEVERPKYPVPAMMIDREIETLRQRQSQLKPLVGRDTAARGDVALVDFVGRIDGRVFKDGRATDYPLELGSGRFLDELENGVVGMRVGEAKELDVQFPERASNPEVAGKRAMFHVTLKALHERLVPALEDEFAKELGHATLAEMRAKVQERIETSATERAAGVARQNAVDQVVKKNAFEVPASLVERQLEMMIEEARRTFSQSGIQAEKVLDMAKLRDEMRPKAADQVRAAFLIDEIAKREGVQAADSDVEVRLQKIERAMGQQGREARRYWEEEEHWEHLRGQVREEKTIDLILSHATFKDVEPKDADEKEAASLGVAEEPGHEGPGHEGHDHAGHDHAGHDHKGHDHK